MNTLPFEYGRFATHLPVEYRYTPSHLWVQARNPGRWRFGLTRFATRMLGELVDHHFDVPLQASVRAGQVLGWIEGFKTVSDILCVGEGAFAGGNPALEEHLGLVNDATYSDGWLYEIEGRLGDPSLDVEQYAAYLRATIDKLRSSQDQPNLKGGPGPWPRDSAS